jgi:pyroglutamyl-peptidase
LTRRLNNPTAAGPRALDAPTSVLLTGFGPFPGVPENPSAALVRAVDGRRVRGVVLRGLVLPVSYARGPALALAVARTTGAAAVIGFGVSARATGLEVERRAVRAARPDLADVDGHALTDLGPGPDTTPATLDADALARALGAVRSDDAGRYVCNAWLYRVSRALPVPVGFVHVPADGADPDELLDGLARFVDATRARAFRAP